VRNARLQSKKQVIICFLLLPDVVDF
jgi:hypothetical protein